MCGFVGFLTPPGSATDDELRSVTREMNAKIHHRGPDDGGEWVDQAAGAALGNRRLAIIDLSPAGHQPMFSSDGRYVITYNGEIYNYREVREQLERERVAYEWKGHCDTEVILAAVTHSGVLGAIKKFNGMFAFALWDRRDHTLYLCRDRLGEKPLYYGWLGDAFVFGSELKGLAEHPAWSGEIDRAALGLYMRQSCVPAPYSIYRGVMKLMPGTLLELPWAGEGRKQAFKTHTYWSATEVATASLADPFRGSVVEAEAELDAVLRRAVASRMESDVPLGAFLSGGIDSSTVTALMQAQSSRPVRTFSIGFAEQAYDETAHARAVAEHLGTAHTSLKVTSEEAMATIPRLAGIYDEPFADSSEIPTLLVSELAKRDVTVALSGDGGDELFGGYTRHFVGGAMWPAMRAIPHPARKLASRMIKGFTPGQWDAAARPIKKMLPKRYGVARPGDSIFQLASLLESASGIDAYRALTSHSTGPSGLLRENGDSEPPYIDGSYAKASSNLVDQMMLLDLITYLPDDLLAKVDRASMAVSLEARVPLLDHRVVEFAWRLPRAMKVQRGEGKLLLKSVLRRYVPAAMVDRPKMGFGIPLGDWLRGPLRDWAEALLGADRLRREGVFDADVVRRTWSEHLSGRRNWADHLWDILMFESWLELQ